MNFVKLIVLSLLISACSSMPTTIIPSTSPVPPGVRGTIEAYGSDCEYYFLGLLPVSGSPNTQVALDRAKESADVDVLTDVTIDHGGGYFILFSNDCVRVRGKGVPRDVLRIALDRSQALEGRDSYRHGYQP